MKTKKHFWVSLILLPLVFFSHPSYGTTPSGKDTVELKVAILHMAPLLGSLKPNLDTLSTLTEKAFVQGAKLIVAPELSTTGYCITEKQVRDSLGLKAPFNSLGKIRALAMQHNGYVVVGIAEIGDDDKLYNSAIMFKPDGSYFLQRKRGLTGWNTRGNLPFDVVSTPFGEIGIAICSDTYLMDWSRIMTLRGADIIATPANWWGAYGQLDTWASRAYENGCMFIVANRWGQETDTRYPGDYVYNMNDAPSAIIESFKSTGSSYVTNALLIYKSENDQIPKNKILYQSIIIPASRIGTQHPHWLVKERQPEAYTDLANSYYRPDKENIPAPDLPPPGNVQVGILSYAPEDDAAKNLSIIYSKWDSSSKNADVIVLPSLGITPLAQAVAPDCKNSFPWKDLDSFVRTNHIQLLVTSYNEIKNQDTIEVMLIFQDGKDPLTIPSIHEDPSNLHPSSPLHIDIKSARIGLALNFDFLFPETSLALAKQGVDIIAVPYTFGTIPYESKPESLADFPYGVFKTNSSVGAHIAASNSNGLGVILKLKWGEVEVVANDASKNMCFQIVTLNTQDVRAKFLNAYYDFDLKTLLDKVENRQSRTENKYIRKMIRKAKNDPSREALTSYALKKQILPPGAYIKE